MKLFAPLLIAGFVAAFSFSAVANEAVVAKYKPDLAKGEASFGAVCAACHGPDGNSTAPIYPKLAQQHAEYLVKQLTEFKAGKRANPIMLGFASTLSEEDMKNISYWVTTKASKPGFAKEKELVTKMSQLEDLIIPDNFNYNKLVSLSNEARQKFTKIQPRTLGQASRISGVNPSDVQILMIFMGR